MDTQLIDNQQSYEWNMERLRPLVRNESSMIHQAMEYDAVLEVHLIDDLREIIGEEETSIKQAKYRVGGRILQDEEYLTNCYRENYFGKLARKLNKRGYSASQLYACVNFAKNPQAEEWLEDEEITWEHIRTWLLPKSLKAFFITWEGCNEANETLQNIQPLLERLAEVYRGVKAVRPEDCKNCWTQQLCKLASKMVKEYTNRYVG